MMPDGGKRADAPQPQERYWLTCTEGGTVLEASEALETLCGPVSPGDRLGDVLGAESASDAFIAAVLEDQPTFDCIVNGQRFSGSVCAEEGVYRVTLSPEETAPEPLKPGIADMTSREMNNYLSSALMALREIRAQLVGEGRQSGAVLQQSLFRLTRLSHNLADCAHVESGTAVLHISEEDAVEVCDRLIERIRLHDLHRIELKWKAPPGPVKCRFDRAIVERILLNLIANAVAVQAPGGEIVVTLNAEAESVVFHVADRGPGIPEGSHVFDKYRASEASAPGSIGGAGYGLALARAYAQRHGGQLGYFGRPGGGTVFRLELPRNLDGALTPLSSTAQDYVGGFDRVLLELSPVLDSDEFGSDE